MIDIEKLKALALAATKRRSVSEEIASLYDFQGEANPAAVLELIAEVERLRAELAAGAAAGGNTSNRGIGSDGAAGTVEKDAAFPAEMTPEMMKAVQIKSELGGFAAANLSGAYDLFREFWQVAIEAHNKAGKGQG